MIAKKILVRRVKSLFPLIPQRVAVLPATLCLAGGLMAFSNAWAVESDNDLATLASEQMAALEPSPQVLEAVKPVEVKLTAQAAEQATAQIQDLDAIVEGVRKQAQVEYLAAKLRKPLQTVKHYVDLAWAEAQRREGMSPELLIAIIYKESTFQPKVQSRYGAQGLMQVVRRWHRDKLKKSESLFDPAVNIRVGADVLEEYLDAANGNLPNALAKYSGNSRGYATRVLGESQRLAKVADKAAEQVVMTSFPLENPSAEIPG